MARLRIFVSINRRSGYSSLETSLIGRFIVASTAERECSDGLLTEKHVFWECEVYEDQRASLTNILSKKRKKEYPESMKFRGKCICSRHLLFHMQIF